MTKSHFLLSWSRDLKQQRTQCTVEFVFFETCLYYAGEFKNPAVLIKANLGNLELPKH